MKFQFDATQPHQLEAIDSVLQLLEGQPRRAAHALMDEGVVRNQLELSDDRLLQNLQLVQQRAGLECSEYLHRLPGMFGHRFPNYSVEMETGTGKTYVYLRTALELADRHGLRKFIVIVPSVAIREGVVKTLHMTSDHFARLYPRVRYRFHRYDGQRIDRVRDFTRSGEVEFMIVTLDAFNKDSNLMRRPMDRLQGKRPLDLLQAVRAVLLLDEPQNMESPRSLESLGSLDPILALRYSATHRRRYGLVHRLTPADAQRQGLVKRIEVAGIDHAQDRVASWSERIRTTIELHLRRQARLRARGIKVLSLFFLDRVDDYLGERAEVRQLFDRHFGQLGSLCPGMEQLPPHVVRAGYFAHKTGKGGRTVAIDSKTGRSRRDETAYRLIMKEKERLLSFEEPVSFLFSHSALREGWDNPNVFQICSLAAPRSGLRKRQEIGRGMRLAVDQAGRRNRSPGVNVLTVVAGEDHASWVEGLQGELLEEFDQDALPTLPRATDVPELEPADATPTSSGSEWVALDEARLIEDAAGRLGQGAGRGHVASAPVAEGGIGEVQDRLGRAMPPIVLPRHTLEAIVARGPGHVGEVEDVVRAVRQALAAQILGDQARAES